MNMKGDRLSESKEAPVLKALDAVIKHLFKGFEWRKPQLCDFGGVHAMWIVISFLAAAPVTP